MASRSQHPAGAPRPRRSAGLLRSLWTAALFGVALGDPAFAQGVPKEYQLKAGFLYNFSKFVQWPADRFSAEDGAIVIAVLGADPFGEELDKVVKDRIVDGHPIEVRRISSASEIPGAHILFVTAGAESRVPDSSLQTRGVLTVGESAAFGTRGGIITFTVVKEKVRFEIDQGAADKAGLKLSGQLLKLATVIRKTP